MIKIINKNIERYRMSQKILKRLSYMFVFIKRYIQGVLRNITAW